MNDAAKWGFRQALQTGLMGLLLFESGSAACGGTGNTAGEGNEAGGGMSHSSNPVNPHGGASPESASGGASGTDSAKPQESVNGGNGGTQPLPAPAVDAGAGGTIEGDAERLIAVIVVQNTSYPQEPNHYSELHAAIARTSAKFVDQVTVCEDGPLTTETVAGCSVHSCFGNPEIIGAGYAEILGDLVDRGPVTATIGSERVTVNYSDGYEWADHPFMTLPPKSDVAWPPAISIQVAGGGVQDLGAFSAAVVLPPHLAASGPLAAPGTLNIPQSAPLNLTWAASAAGEGDVATIEIVGQGVASSSGARAPWVVGICQASLAGGSFALPPAVSARFEQGATAQLTVSADQRMTTVAANAQPVSLIARDVLIDFVKFSL